MLGQEQGKGHDFLMKYSIYRMSSTVRDGPFDIPGGGGPGIFFEKNSSFPNRSEKNKR